MKHIKQKNKAFFIAGAVLLASAVTVGAITVTQRSNSLNHAGDPDGSHYISADEAILNDLNDTFDRLLATEGQDKGDASDASDSVVTDPGNEDVTIKLMDGPFVGVYYAEDYDRLEVNPVKGNEYILHIPKLSDEFIIGTAVEDLISFTLEDGDINVTGQIQKPNENDAVLSIIESNHADFKSGDVRTYSREYKFD